MNPAATATAEARIAPSGLQLPNGSVPGIDTMLEY